MSRRGILILVGGFLAGSLVAISLIYGLGSQAAPHPPQPGGQKVTDTVYKIRFDRQYDLFCSFYKEPTIYRNCRILGFTGRGKGLAGSGLASGGSSFGSVSMSAPSDAEDFDHWLVLKLADGRLAYIPPGAIKYIEEAAGKGE